MCIGLAPNLSRRVHVILSTSINQHPQVGRGTHRAPTFCIEPRHDMPFVPGLVVPGAWALPLRQYEAPFWSKDRRILLLE